MGITNTIASIKDFFKQWHDKEYDELHEDTNSAVNSINQRLQTVESHWNNNTEILVQNTASRLSTLTSESTSTLKDIDNRIDALTPSLTSSLTTWEESSSGGITVQKLPSIKLAILNVNVGNNYQVANKNKLIKIGQGPIPERETFGTTYNPWYTSIKIGANGIIYYMTIYPKDLNPYKIRGTIVYKYK